MADAAPALSPRNSRNRRRRANRRERDKLLRAAAAPLPPSPPSLGLLSSLCLDTSWANADSPPFTMGTRALRAESPPPPLVSMSSSRLCVIELPERVAQLVVGAGQGNFATSYGILYSPMDKLLTGELLSMMEKLVEE